MANLLLNELMAKSPIPRLVACSSQGFLKKDIQKTENYNVVAFELRLDLLQKEYPQNFKQIVNQNLHLLSNKRIILTVRSKEEGGVFQGTTKEKEKLYIKYLSSAFAVDIEVRELSRLSNLLTAAKEQNKIIIASYHNFSSVPPIKNLQQCVSKGKKFEADVVKIAVYADNPIDLSPLLLLQYKEKTMPLSLMSMGKTALLSRLFLSSTGSIWTYASIGNPTAPYQPTCKQIAEYYKMLIP
jgi:3-dehydroquinate dehydratase-1